MSPFSVAIDKCSAVSAILLSPQVFWSYIVAMLTNLGSLSLDRILSMLRMFALSSTSSLECNREELRQFLDTKMREGQLTFDGENYKLIKSD